MNINQFARDEDGAVAVIIALLLVVLVGFTALGVDTASLYRDRAQLQSVSDLAAMSAMSEPANASSRARNAVTRNSTSADALTTLETGRFLRNPAISPADRFTPLPSENPGVNAVRVGLRDLGALHFARIFTEESSISLTRNALATQSAAVSFALDSHLVDVNNSTLNEALELRFGASASIMARDMNALANTRINLGSLLDTLQTQSGSLSLNPAEILSSRPSGGQVISALQSVLPQTLAGSLSSLANATSASEFAVSALVRGIDKELGLTATEFLAEIDLTALDVVKALVDSTSTTGRTTIASTTTVPGVLSAQTSLRTGEPPAKSGWIALGEEGVQLHRAAIRLRSDINFMPERLGVFGPGIEITSVNLPIYTELAGSTARLDHLSCNRRSSDHPAARFRTSHTPLDPANGTSVAALYLGELRDKGVSPGPIVPSDLGFADLITLSIVIDVPLLADIVIPGVVIQARSTAAVGASRTETITFTHREVARGEKVKSFGAGDLLGSAVNSLLSPANTEFRIKPGQNELISGLAAPLIGSVMALLPQRLLNSFVAPVDGVLNSALAGLGVEIGSGELTMIGHHCEPIRLVR